MTSNDEKEQKLLDYVEQFLEKEDEDSRNKLLEVVKERIQDLMNGLERNDGRKYNQFDETFNKGVISLILERLEHPELEEWENIKTSIPVDVHIKGETEFGFLDKLIKNLK